MKKDHEKVLLKVEEGIKEALKNKLYNYKRETNYMPFQNAILGKTNCAIYSFGISISTWLGQNRKGGYEEIARILAETAGSKVITQYEIPFSITKSTENKIYDIYKSIRKGETKPTTKKLAKRIKSFAKQKKGIHEDRVVDVFIRDKEDNLYFIDISSPKSNMKESYALKLKLLNWLALGYANYKAKTINAFIGLPYNPYHPKPYDRFSTKIFDRESDIFVQEKLWNTFAGFDVYDDLIRIVEKVGQENMVLLKQKVSELD